ncbi:hypothetical protein AVEN_75494-1 [Araneus ventricosus]|uniref:DUF5641 domain-containing protein n=1 Tax=Araneus ventricosus TaxID=182803 RepID=A0A4Y2DPB9_ARAVE|nr:hypothetical protein AVEN_75494-1 [Araneus ventricosus]
MLSAPSVSVLPQSTNSELTRGRRRQLDLVSAFWNSFFRKNYLIELRTAHKYLPKCKKPVFTKKDSIVQIHEDKMPKMMWKGGLMTKLHVGRDGKTRSCTVRLPSGTFLKRLVQLLYPLELEDN